jgi:hypothetical protein
VAAKAVLQLPHRKSGETSFINAFVLSQGRRRISEILRRPSANDSSESFMLVATSITKDENSILTEVTYVWRIRLRCHCELAAGDRGNPRVRGIVGTDLQVCPPVSDQLKLNPYVQGRCLPHHNRRRVVQKLKLVPGLYTSASKAHPSVGPLRRAFEACHKARPESLSEASLV